MAPAQQRLHADDATLAQLHLRLVVQLQFLALQGAAQILFHRQPLQGADMHVASVELNVVAAVFLGSIHGGIGVFQQGFHILAVPGEQADADTGGHETLMVFNLKGGFKGFQELARKVRHPFLLAQPFQHADEFVAAHAGDSVLLAPAVQQARRHRPQQAHRRRYGPDSR